MKRSAWLGFLCAAMTLSPLISQQTAFPGPVPMKPLTTDLEQVFHDPHYGVSFRLPPGWDLARKDGEVSTFHLDVRSAPPATKLRAIATIHYNPYPNTTLSGAMFYYSVLPHATEAGCVAEAVAHQTDGTQEQRPSQDIDGMSFAHGHDEYGTICIEARDEIYAAYRKGSCYRFDLLLNTFCSVSSGVRDMDSDQMLDVEQKLADILSTVQLKWTKVAPHPVPVPELQPADPAHTPLKRSSPTAGTKVGGC
jgi:hypothetical protein